MCEAIGVYGLGLKAPIPYEISGVMFIKFIDASNIVKDANNLFQLLDAIVMEVEGWTKKNVSLGGMVEAENIKNKRWTIDGDDKSTTAYLYDALEKSKTIISGICANEERGYKQYCDIIDERCLNPAVQYVAESKASKDPNIRRALQHVSRVLVPNMDTQIEAFVEVDAFMDGVGAFGTKIAIQSRTK
ncbi:hypothetical protein ACH5RR_025751 [Cinchona calisaya]|uniref:Uncharacterized protein n=1 Tax=Cinchona calisaya TaxID=153742 RepID=A0ABD2Z1M6_9GENT